MRLAVVVTAAVLTAAQFAAGFEEKGSIEGRVVNAVSGDAVRRVNLTLTKLNAKGDPATAQTDGEGRFTFADLDAGAYRLAGERPGFARQAYGARLNPNLGAILVVAAGQALKDIKFKLAPDAVISGQVLDQEGEPMPNLLVSARRYGYSSAKREWVNAGTMQTNDRGEYRIAGLRPGRYIVLAANMNLGIAIAGVSRDAYSDKPDMAYASTYYGNTLDVTRAAPIDIKMGDDRRGANIQMIKTTTVRVRGKVVNPPDTGQLVLILMRKGTGTGQAPGNIAVVQGTEGLFEITGVTPGSYILTARSATDPLKTAGAMPVEVGEKHVEGLEFRLAPGSEIKGRLAMRGDKPEGEAITVTLDSPDSAGEDPSTRVGDDGRFTLAGVFPGNYAIRVRNLPDNAYVRAVKLGGQEVDESRADFAGTAEMEIVVSRTGAQVEGVVADAAGKPAAGATVALVPESKRDSSYASATTDQAGAFTVKGLRPGKYKALAWEDIEGGAFRDPEFVKVFEGRAQAVALEEGGRLKVKLTAIPFADLSKE